MASSNGSNVDYSDENVGSNHKTNDYDRMDAADSIESGTWKAVDNHLCDANRKLDARQQCTTGIDCTPITLGTGNIDVIPTEYTTPESIGTLSANVDENVDKREGEDVEESIDSEESERIVVEEGNNGERVNIEVEEDDEDEEDEDDDEVEKEKQNEKLEERENLNGSDETQIETESKENEESSAKVESDDDEESDEVDETDDEVKAHFPMKMRQKFDI